MQKKREKEISEDVVPSDRDKVLKIIGLPLEKPILYGMIFPSDLSRSSHFSQFLPHHLIIIPFVVICSSLLLPFLECKCFVARKRRVLDLHGHLYFNAESVGFFGVLFGAQTKVQLLVSLLA